MTLVHVPRHVETPVVPASQCDTILGGNTIFHDINFSTALAIRRKAQYAMNITFAAIFV
jgi:hypothetical protein